ncbi:ribonuclease H-like domain-containing protein, partial [Tanacetum coccineum]
MPNTTSLQPHPNSTSTHPMVTHGPLSMYKALLVANGNNQQIGVDYEEIFSTVVKPATIRSVFSLDASRHWHVHQLDVKNVFLHDIGYGFLPFSFSSFEELEKDAVSLLKLIRKFFVAQDIGARAAIHIFNRINFAITKREDHTSDWLKMVPTCDWLRMVPTSDWIWISPIFFLFLEGIRGGRIYLSEADPGVLHGSRHDHKASDLVFLARNLASVTCSLTQSDLLGFVEEYGIALCYDPQLSSSEKTALDALE